MAIFVTNVKSKPQKVEAKPKKPARRYKWKPPTAYQELARQEVVQFLLHNRGERRSYIFEKLREKFGLEVEECRIYKSGGVGTYIWMKRNRCYRVQVAASKIDTRKFCYPYAKCVNIY